MPRVPRVSVPGIALHVVQRGNNRQAVFFHKTDNVAYLDLLFESAARYESSVHVYFSLFPPIDLSPDIVMEEPFQ